MVAPILRQNKSAKAEQIQKHIEENFNKLNSLINLVVGAVNTIAGRAVFDAKSELFKRKDIYRQEVKMNAKLAEKAYYDYERLHTRNFGGRYNMFLDYLSAVEDNIAKDIDILTYSIAQVLTKNNQKDAMLKAKVETARTMCEYACCMFDRLIKEANTRLRAEQVKMFGLQVTSKPFDFMPYFAPARLTKVFHYWDKVTAKICKTDKDSERIALNDDPNCKLAFEIIERKVTSEDFINKAGYEALKLNPEHVREISEEDYNELVGKFGGQE